MNVKQLILFFAFFWAFSGFSQLQVVPQSFSSAYITHAVYCHAEKIIAVAEYRVSRLGFLDAKSKLKITEIPTEGAVISLATDSAGKYIVAGTEQGRIHFIDTKKLTVSKTINANAAIGSGYFAFLNYFPLLFTREHLYFTGYVDRTDSSFRGNYKTAEKPEITDYYLYRYSPAANELNVLAKTFSNKPYSFFWNKQQNTITLLAEKYLLTVNTKNAKASAGTSTKEIGMSTFSGSYHFLDDVNNNRLGLLYDGDNKLRIFNPETLQQTDSLNNVYRFLKLNDGRLLYQGTDRYFYTYRFESRESKKLTTDSITFRPWCYALLDFRQGIIGSVTVSGIGTVNMNLPGVDFPPGAKEPLPWGVCTTGTSTLVYATDNIIYEFNYANLNYKKEVARLATKVKQCLFVPGDTSLLIVIAVEYNRNGALVSDSVIALNYQTGSVIWKHSIGSVKLDNARLSNDKKNLLLLTDWSKLTVLDVTNGNVTDEFNSPDRVYGADFKGKRNEIYAGLVHKEDQYHIQGFAGKVAPFSYKFFKSHYPFRVFELDKTKNYAAVAYPEDSRFYVIPLGKDIPFREVQNNARVLAFSHDNKWLAGGSFNGGTVRLYEFPSLEEKITIKCGVGKVYDLLFSEDGNLLFALLEDGYISIINIAAKKLVADIILTEKNFLVKTPSGYFTANKSQVNDIGLRNENRCYPISNADIKFNRPDLILEETGTADSVLIKAYAKAYQKRLKKAGIDAALLDKVNSFPEAAINNAQYIPAVTAGLVVRIPVSFSVTGSFLKSFNIWVDDVPLFGAAGKELKGKPRQKLDTVFTVRLNPGRNIIEAECTSLAGIRSIKDQVKITCSAQAQSKIWFVGIGIDKFADSGYNLSYSVKDIRDLSAKLKEKYGGDISIDTLLNEQVSISNIKALKQRLKRSTENDRVIIAYSGHGLLSKDFNYYLSTYAVNFENPQQNGLPYEEMENLLDSIPARKKLMLIDACHSGEVDKEEMILITSAAESLKQKGTRGGQPTYTGKTTLGMKNSFELMQSLFVNVGKSTGATVISAAAGTQFAHERGDLKNGVFTYSILEAMNNHPALKISELKKIVGERVDQLTNGLQKPTSRNETIVSDWSLW